MNSLHIDAELLRQAEHYAQERQVNLSQMVEAFIRHFVKNSSIGNAKRGKVTPFVERLGVDLELPSDFDEKAAYRNYLEEKYK